MLYIQKLVDNTDPGLHSIQLVPALFQEELDLDPCFSARLPINTQVAIKTS